MSGPEWDRMVEAIESARRAMDTPEKRRAIEEQAAAVQQLVNSLGFSES